MDFRKVYSWVGSQRHYVDEINIQPIGHVLLGRFGGNSSINKKIKNEDGCIVWVNEELDVEFAVLLDAHKTAESAELVVATIQSLQSEIRHALSLPTQDSFKKLQNLLLTTFESQSFRNACQNVEGETACLLVAKERQVSLVAFYWRLYSSFTSPGTCSTQRIPTKSSEFL